MRKTFVLHPLLFALYTVLFLLAQNLNEAFLSEIFLPLGIVLGLTFALWLGAWFCTRSFLKGALLTTLLLFFIFSYGHVYYVLEERFGSFQHRFLFGVYLAFLSLGVLAIFRCQKSLSSVTRLLNVIAIVLLIMPASTVAIYAAKTYKSENKAIHPAPDEFKLRPGQESGETRVKPDIYYLIFDRYGSDSVLKNYYNFDNRGFLENLKNRGFVVLTNAYANYLKTAPSLASSLNMQFLDPLSVQFGENTGDYKPMMEMIKRPGVPVFLKSQGYRYFHLGSWWEGTGRSEIADVNMAYSGVSEFSMMLYRTTFFNYLIAKYVSGQKGRVNFSAFVADDRELLRKRTLYQFEKIAQIASEPGPKYVFAHFLVPHPPYIFDREGRPVSEEQEKKRGMKTAFADQVVFVNQQIEKVVDQILAKSPQPPVIILQADEGPFPDRYEKEGKTFDWTTASDEELKEKMGILNACYIPDEKLRVKIYETMTPVNTFRILLNSYFDMGLELLPDESYAFQDEDHLYRFFSVTDKLR